MTKEWRERLDKILIALLTTVFTVVLTAIIKGDELKGLGKIAALLKILRFGVPLWLFITTLVVAIFGVVQWAQSRRKKILYVVWDPIQCLWGTGAMGDIPVMQLIMKGFFTNADLEKSLLITQVYLEGTKAAMALLSPIEIKAHHSIVETIHAFVQPVVGVKGERYKGNLILIDQFNRHHKLPVNLRGIDPVTTATVTPSQTSTPMSQ